METLAAFVRQHSQGQVINPGMFPLDIRAAMVVIERRKRAFDEEELELDLRYANLPYLRLGKRADLRGLDFEGATLDHVHLSEADLSGVNLRGASLTYARLDHARLSTSQLLAANMKGASLVWADLRGAMLSGATLYKAWLYNVDLRGAFLRSYDGPDRNGELVSYIPALLGADGSQEAANLGGAVYDGETQWPNMPPDFPFDPETRGARRADPNPA
jgi:uncharacterized protein YjbI with pentapeptide repeats